VGVTDAAVSRPSARVSAARPFATTSPGHRRGRRLAAAAALSAAAALLLSACGDSRPGTAAVVGAQRITDGDLQNLVTESLDAPGVRAALPASDYKGDIGAYRRAVLNVEVERLLAESGAQKLGIAVDENAVDSRYKFFEDQSGGSSSFASQLATRLAVSPSLYRQLVRTEVIESEIGYTQGGVARPTAAQLQALYAQYLPTAVSATLSLIQVPDQATANAAATAIRRAPDTFAAVAAQFAGSGSQTAPDAQKYVLSRLPADLAARLEKTPKNTIFPYALANGDAKAYFVIRFGSIDTPSLEDARPQLEAQTLQQAAAAGQKYLQQVAKDQGVTVNPRYGSWEAGQLAITDFVNPVIKPTPSPAASSAPVLPDGGTGDGTTGGSGATDGSQPAPTPTP
jgi:peptidyl-prolyl cis-trans isomerase SurA